MALDDPATGDRSASTACRVHLTGRNSSHSRRTGHHCPAAAHTALEVSGFGRYLGGCPAPSEPATGIPAVHPTRTREFGFWPAIGHLTLFRCRAVDFARRPTFVFRLRAGQLGKLRAVGLLLTACHHRPPNRARTTHHQGGLVAECDRDICRPRTAWRLPNQAGSNPFHEKTHWPDSVAEPALGSWRTKPVRQTRRKAIRSSLHRNL